MLIERLMRSLVIELHTEMIELALLRTDRRSRWTGGLGFERAMHALVPSVLLRLAGLDELGQHAQAYPPCRQARQSRQRVGRERHPVVGANALRQAVLTEQPREHRLRQCNSGRLKRLATEQIARIAIGHGERITVATVTGLELSFVIRAPHRIGFEHRAG